MSSHILQKRQRALQAAMAEAGTFDQGPLPSRSRELQEAENARHLEYEASVIVTKHAEPEPYKLGNHGCYGDAERFFVPEPPANPKRTLLSIARAARKKMRQGRVSQDELYAVRRADALFERW